MTPGPTPPWWSSGDDPGVSDDPDPVTRHRAARRGGQPDDGRAAPWWVPAAEAITRLGRDLAAAAADDPDGARTRSGSGPGAEEPEATGQRTAEPGGPTPHRIDACGVCPICVGLRALGDVRPELAGHLAEAARHLALAVRTIVDAAVPTDVDPRRDRHDDPLTRIDLDGDP
jgi:hypothetical protein